MSRATTAAKQAIFVGDSLLQWFTRDGADSYRKHFSSKYNCINLGVPGDSTDQTIQRLTTGGLLDHPGILPSTTPKLAILLIGTNDIGRGQSEDYIAGRIGEIIQILKDKLGDVRILLLGLLPRQSLSHKPGTINGIIAQYADGGTRFLDVSNNFATTKDGRTTLKSKLYSDGLHLSSSGYQVLAESISPVFEDMITEK